MACQAYQDKVHAYFDRELDAGGRDEFMAHLRDCADCRWDFKLYRKMFQTMEQMDADAPQDLPSRIMATVRGMGMPLPWAGIPSWYATPQAMGLAAAAVFVVAVYAGLETRRPLAPPFEAPRPVMQQAAAEPLPVRAVEPAESRLGPIRVTATGRVEVLRRGTSEWSLVSANERIGYEDRVRTGADASAVIEYPDRASLRVKPGSLVQVLDQAVRVFQGDTWIKVERKGSRFEARTPNAVASVRGTMYAVRVERIPFDRDQLLAVAEGALEPGADSASGPNASVSAASAPLTLAERLRLELLGRFRTSVKVYESTVAVQAVDPATGERKPERLVGAGYGTAVTGDTVLEAAALEPADYLAWKLPVPAAVLHQATVAAARPAAEPVAGAPVGLASGGVLGLDAGTGLPQLGPVEPPADEPTASAAPRPGSGPLGYDGLQQR